MKSNNKGFTLIEVITVVLVIFIITAIATPIYTNIVSNSKIRADIASAKQIGSSLIFVISEYRGNVANFSNTEFKSDSSNDLIKNAVKDFFNNKELKSQNGKIFSVSYSQGTVSVFLDNIEFFNSSRDITFDELKDKVNE